VRLRLRLDFSTNQSCRCIKLTRQCRANHINLMLRFWKRSKKVCRTRVLRYMYLFKGLIIWNLYTRSVF